MVEREPRELKNVNFSVEPALVKKGVKVGMAVFTVPEITRRRSSGLKRHIKEIIDNLKIEEGLASPILTEYRKFYDNVGIKGVPPAEHLLKLIQKSGMLPNINKVVDCYNIVSEETLLSIGAHDLAHINGDIQFKYTDGTEKYTPLGQSEPEKVVKGEYACMDDEKILCRMDIKQCDETKVGQGTTDFIVYVQGNKATDEAYVSTALKKVCDNITNFCGGEYRVL